MITVVCFTAFVFATPLLTGAFQTTKVGCTELTIYGFLRNNTGVFERTQEWTTNGNQLMMEATELRTNILWKFSDQWSLFSAIEFSYEPWYKIEGGHFYYPVQGTTTSTQSSKRPNMELLPGGKEYSKYDDINDVLRELYIEYRPNKNHSFRLGRQIVTWGEALTDRIGDVINPDDTRSNFSGVNTEDTRIPQWMINAVHNFQLFGTNTMFQWIIQPNIVGENYRYNYGGNSFNAGGYPETRNAVPPEETYYPGVGRSGFLVPPSPSLISGIYGITGVIPFCGYGTEYPGQNSFNPECITVNPIANTVPQHFWNRNPRNSLEDLRYGAKIQFTTGIGQYGFSWWHTQNTNIPVVQREVYQGNMIIPLGPGGFPYVNAGPKYDFTINHDITYDIFGFFFNKQLSFIPGDTRIEVTWTPNFRYNTWNCLDGESCVVRRDNFRYMIGYDLGNAFLSSWHSTHGWDFTVEHVGEFVPNARDIQSSPLWATKQPSWHGGIRARVSTNWFYNLLSTSMVIAYDTFGDMWMFNPNVTWTPEFWDSRLSIGLQYQAFTGDGTLGSGSMFRKKHFFLLTTQFNF